MEDSEDLLNTVHQPPCSVEMKTTVSPSSSSVSSVSLRYMTYSYL